MADTYQVLKIINKQEQSLFMEALKLLDRGDPAAGRSIVRQLVVRAYLSRRKPEALLEVLKAYRPVLKRIDESEAYGSLWEQFALNLTGSVPHRVELFSESFDEARHLQGWRDDRDHEALFAYHFARGTLHYLYGEFAEAVTHLKTGSGHMNSEASRLLREDHARVYGLARIAMGRSPGSGGGSVIARAENARLAGKERKARRLYSMALRDARRGGDGLLEAVIHELEGVFHLKHGRRKFGASRITRARDLFQEWGAGAKALYLEEVHGLAKPRGGDHETTFDATATNGGAARVDLSQLIEDSRALTEEIVYDELTRRIVLTLLNRSGANRCVVWSLPANGKSGYVEAMGDAIQVYDEEHPPVLPREVLERVRLTMDLMTLKEAREDNLAREYKTPAGRPAMAFLCAPLLRQGELLGILYLESTEEPDLFTADNIEFARILSTQAAISLGNAGLYAQLEEKVSARTRELNGALAEVQALKEKQDGDYFLTSLLTTPLMEIAAGNERVRVDSFVRQKKQFRFRKWETEIGGDINVAHSLELANRPCTVFLNADAMGKSIQGAGGVLVVGAVFASIIKRTRAVRSLAARSPQEWLEATAVDLHRVFESFDGSMLISVVLGVLDDETGRLRYVVAEHPRVVLYRRGEARLLEPARMHAKLGMPGTPDLGVLVEEMQLEPGDVIISGTDGRDDISMGRDEFNQQMINEDDTAFPRAVEEGEGDLERIHTVLSGRGELIDDIALLRLEYLGGANTNARDIGEAKESISMDAKTNETKTSAKAGAKSPARLAREQVQLRDYDRAVSIVRRALEEDGESAELYFILSYALKKQNRPLEARKAGEKALALKPAMLPNLVNLAHVHAITGGHERAKELLEMAEDLDANDPGLEKMRRIVKRWRVN